MTFVQAYTRAIEESDGAGGPLMTDVIPIPRRNPGHDSLVSADEIAERWGVHRDTVYRIPPSDLPYVKLGTRTRRYRWAEVLEYEQQRIVTGE